MYCHAGVISNKRANSLTEKDAIYGKVFTRDRGDLIRVIMSHGYI